MKTPVLDLLIRDGPVADGLGSPLFEADVAVCDGRSVAAGGKRLLQKAEGYRATIVSGTITYRDGEATGALPVRLVRGPQQPVIA